jgi:ABC-2 type transport system permease protein
MFPGELEIDKFILLNLGVFCLHIALMGFCFFVCCITDESKKAIGINAGILVFFYLIHMIANTGDKLENFKYATIFSMFNPRDIIAGETYTYVMMAVLLMFGVTLLIIGGYIFTKRDLPL